MIVAFGFGSVLCYLHLQHDGNKMVQNIKICTLELLLIVLDDVRKVPSKPRLSRL